MTYEFYKYQGTGNDFIIIDNRNKKIDLTEQQVYFLCDRKFGIGADGLMFLQEREGYDFEMIYYNSDGKLGSMCGNGSRCLTQFAFDMGIKKNHYSFIASDGDHESEFDATNNWVRVKMIDVNNVEEFKGRLIVDTGSPHYIQYVESVDDIDVYQEGKKIRYSDLFDEKGINVNFVQKKNINEIKVRTYERGVENETLSCGTGVTASALVSFYSEGLNKINVETLGGKLAVEFEKIGEGMYKNVWLCGPATFVFKGEINF